MKNEELIKRLVKLQILCIRWVERNTELVCSTHREMDRVLMGNKLTCTYGLAVNNLKEYIEKYIKNDYLREEIYKLKMEIEESSIVDLRFGLEPQKKFTDEEKELDSYKLKRTLFMLNEMVDIKYVVKNLRLSESQVKQACQSERLMNTRKVGKTWQVHIPECRLYWDIPDKDNTHLYKDWVY